MYASDQKVSRGRERRITQKGNWVGGMLFAKVRVLKGHGIRGKETKKS